MEEKDGVGQGSTRCSADSEESGITLDYFLKALKDVQNSKDVDSLP